MRKYEAVFILDTTLEDGGKVFIETLSPLIKDDLQGEIVSVQEIGQRSFAYPIGKKASGYYWSIITLLPPENVVVLKRKFQRNPSVLRLEVLMYDKNIDESSDKKKERVPSEVPAEKDKASGETDNSSKKKERVPSEVPAEKDKASGETDNSSSGKENVSTEEDPTSANQEKIEDK